MSNHFHLVFEVPKPRPLSIDEVLERIAALHPEEAQALRVQQARLAEQPDGLEQFDRLLDKYRRRMNDPSIFVKELKGGFAQWYNRKYNRYGALWAERIPAFASKRRQPRRRLHRHRGLTQALKTSV